MYADAVATQFHITLDQMFSGDRRRDIVDARQMLYFICMERPIRISYIHRAKSLIDNDPDYQDIVDQIQLTNAKVS